MLKTELDRFKLVAMFEGISFIVLLFIAMPLKYIWLMPMATKIVGMIHGGLFLLYLYAQYEASKKYGWGLKDNAIYLLASVIPFGTFFSDRRLAKIKADLD